MDPSRQSSEPNYLRPTTMTLLLRDRTCEGILALPITLWVLCFCIEVMDWRTTRFGDPITSPPWTFFLLAVAASAVCLPLAYWRLSRLHEFFRTARTTPAQVVEANASYSGTAVRYVFLHGGRQFSGKVNLGKDASWISEGQELPVIFDPSAPGKNFLELQFD